MSTRANIKIIGFNAIAYLYKHNDGYPDGLGNDLKQFIAEHGYFSNNYYPFTYKLLKTYPNIQETHSIHGDISYLYEIDLTNKTFKCFRCNYKYEEYPNYIRTFNEIKM
jgi:hypothetical protein